jgi:hypothetical protein
LEEGEGEVENCMKSNIKESRPMEKRQMESIGEGWRVSEQ